MNADSDAGNPNEDSPIKLGDAIDEIESMALRYTVLPDPSLATVVALWIVGTYAFRHFDYCGYLALRSATPRCGKSRLLRLIGLLANGKPPITTTPTAAVLFRAEWPVLLLDEVDALRNQDKEKFSEVLAVLNRGFERGGVVCRADGRNHQVSQYEVYGPKALAGIEALADTLADRVFHIQMKRADTRPPRLNPRKAEPTCARIRAGVAKWVQLHGNVIEAAYQQLPDVLPDLEQFDDRFQDISEPLFVLAALADSERPERPTVRARLLRGLFAAAGSREPSSRERTISILLELFDERIGNQADIFLPSDDILDLCKEREDLSHIETSRKLAALLKLIELRPIPNGKKRGYRLNRSWVEEWRKRYPGVMPTRTLAESFQLDDGGGATVKASKGQCQSVDSIHIDVSSDVAG